MCLSLSLQLAFRRLFFPDVWVVEDGRRRDDELLSPVGHLLVDLVDPVPVSWRQPEIVGARQEEEGAEADEGERGQHQEDQGLLPRAEQHARHHEERCDPQIR
jgi:hypothetical protein